MAQRAFQQRPDLKAVPMLLNEPLYIGVDIGKAKHVAGFLSSFFLVFSLCSLCLCGENSPIPPESP